MDRGMRELSGRPVQFSSNPKTVLGNQVCFGTVVLSTPQATTGLLIDGHVP